MLIPARTLSIIPVRRNSMRRWTACVLALALSAVAHAEGFPEKPPRFIVGFTPGGPSDIIARALGQKLSESWAQHVVIENRPGAGGNIAAGAAPKSAPDRYTRLLGNNSTLPNKQRPYRR